MRIITPNRQNNPESTERSVSNSLQDSRLWSRSANEAGRHLPGLPKCHRAWHTDWGRAEPLDPDVWLAGGHRASSTSPAWACGALKGSGARRGKSCDCTSTAILEMCVGTKECSTWEICVTHKRRAGLCVCSRSASSGIGRCRLSPDTILGPLWAVCTHGSAPRMKAL